MWNDPINWVDPSGEFAQIAIGFFSGFVTDVLWQVLIDGYDLSCINYKRALIAGVTDAAGVGLLKLFSKARILYKLNKAEKIILNTQIRSSGAKYILESPTKLIVKEHHFKDIAKIFKQYKGRMNLFRKDFWKHVFPHKHIYETTTPPKMLQNWRKSFQKAKAVKTTKIGL